MGSLLSFSQPLIWSLPYELTPRTDPGPVVQAIPVSGGYFALTSVGAEARTLAAPAVHGTQLLLVFDVDGGDITLTCANPITESGATTLTFRNAGEFARLESYEDGADLRWRLLAYTPQVTWMADPGPVTIALPTFSEGYLLSTTAAGETRTLAAPATVGQRMTLVLQNTDLAATDTIILTIATLVSESGISTLTFRNQGEFAELVSVSDTLAGQLRWRLVSATEAILWRNDVAAGALDPGSVGYNISIGAGAEVTTMAAPNSVGQELTLQVAADGGGSREITFAPAGESVREGGATPGVATFINEGDMARFKACTTPGGLAWRLIWEDLGAGSSVT